MADELGGGDRAGDGGGGDIRGASAGFQSEGLIHGFDQITEIKGLRQVVEGAETHGLDRCLHRAVAGDHDDRGVGVFSAAGFDQIETVHVADPQIDNDEVWRLLANGGKAFGARLKTENIVTGAAAQLAHQFENGGLIIYDYYFSHS